MAPEGTDPRHTERPGSTATGAGKAVPFWRTIWFLLRPHRKGLGWSAICALIVGAAVAFQPLCIKWIIDNGVLRKGPDGNLAAVEQRWHGALLFVGLYVALSVTRMTVGLTGVKFLVFAVEDFLAGLRGRFFAHVQHLCLRFHDRVSSGELFNYMMGTPMGSLKTFLWQAALVLPLQIVAWVIAAASLASFNLPLTLITLAVVAIIIAVNRRSRVRVQKLAGTYMEAESAMSKYVADMLRGTRAIKIHALEVDVVRSVQGHIEELKQYGAQMAWRQTLENGKAESIQYAGLAVLYATGAYFCLYRRLEVGTFFAFIASVQLLLWPLMGILNLNLIRANAQAGLERIVKVLDEEATTIELPPGMVRRDLARQRATARAQGTAFAEFRDVHFSYDGRQPVFAGLSVTIPQGQSVALVGPSGSGKSTFVALLLRLYDPQRGDILLHGAELWSYALHDVRASFGVVPQDPFMFQGTVLDNLKVTRPNASEEEMRRVMDLALVTEFVERMPDGLQTRVGEGGATLSGGQRQRLALARALLSQPEAFIFDEATAALDNQSERQIQQALEELFHDHTTLVIAHRLSTIRKVGRILVFDRGRIVQDGTYERLAAEEGLFRDLVRGAEQDTLVTPRREPP